MNITYSDLSLAIGKLDILPHAPVTIVIDDKEYNVRSIIRVDGKIRFALDK